MVKLRGVSLDDHDEVQVPWGDARRGRKPRVGEEVLLVADDSAGEQRAGESVFHGPVMGRE